MDVFTKPLNQQGRIAERKYFMRGKEVVETIYVHVVETSLGFVVGTHLGMC